MSVIERLAGTEAYAAQACACTPGEPCALHPWPFNPSPGGPVVGAPVATPAKRVTICTACGGHQGLTADNGKSKVRAACVCLTTDVAALRSENAALRSEVASVLRRLAALEEKTEPAGCRCKESR